MLSEIEGIHSLTLASDSVHRRLAETLLSASDPRSRVQVSKPLVDVQAHKHAPSGGEIGHCLSQWAAKGRFVSCDADREGVNPSALLLTFFRKRLTSINMPFLPAAVVSGANKYAENTPSLGVDRSELGAIDGVLEEAEAVESAGEERGSSEVAAAAFTSPCVRMQRHDQSAGETEMKDEDEEQRAPLIDITEIVFGSGAAARGSLESIRLSHNVTSTWAVDVPQWATGLFPTKNGRSQQTHQRHRDYMKSNGEHQQCEEHGSSSTAHSLSLTLLGAFMLDSLSPFDCHHEEPFVSQSCSHLLSHFPQPSSSLFLSLVSPPTDLHFGFISTIVELDVTFNTILKSFPRGLQRLRKVFFEYCEALEDLDGLADGQVEDCFVGACQNFVVFPRGLSKLRKLELNWCTYTADLSALSFPASDPTRRGSCSSDPQQGKKSEESDGDGNVVAFPSDPHPRLRELIINHNYRLMSLPNRLFSLVSIRLDKCEGLRSAASLSGLPLFESITIACCPALTELPNWWPSTAIRDQQTNSDEENGKGDGDTSDEINESVEISKRSGCAAYCSVKKIIINETAVEDLALVSMLLSCRNSLEDVDISFNQRLCHLDFSKTKMQVQIGHLFSDAFCDRLETSIFPKLHTLTVISCSGLVSLGLFFDDLVAIEEKALRKVQRTEDDMPPLPPTISHYSTQHEKQKQEQQRQVFAPLCRLPSLQTLNLIDLEVLESISLTRETTSLNSLQNNNYHYDNRGRANRLSCVSSTSSSYSKFPLLTTLSLAWCVCLPPQTLGLLLSGGDCPSIQRLDATGCHNFTDLVISESEGGRGYSENVVQQQSQGTANAMATADSGRIHVSREEEELDKSTPHVMMRFPTQHKLEKLILEGCSSLVLAIVAGNGSTIITEAHVQMTSEEEAEKDDGLEGHAISMSGMHASRRHQFSRGDEETDALLDDEANDDDVPTLILTHTNFPLLKELNVTGCRLNRRGASAHYHQNRYCNGTRAELVCGPPIISVELEGQLTRLIT